MTHISFAGLSTLPKLSKVSIEFENAWEMAHPFQCTFAQTACLARCASLHSLRCGAWNSLVLQGESERRAWYASSKGQQMLRQGIGLLAKNKVPLVDFTLDATAMSSAVWERVSQMTSLTTLCPLIWYADVSSKEFERLVFFKDLRAFKMRMTQQELVAVEDATSRFHTRLGPITADRFLPSLLHCKHVQYLELSHINLSRRQLEQIVTSFVELDNLILHRLHVEGVEPLASAHRLVKLTLHCCTQDAAAAAAAPLNFRETLPPMPFLYALTLRDVVQISSEHAALLNPPLLARMPKLKAHHFHQNLLIEEPAAAPAVAVAAP
jgi:hypothetical protein